jgi:hypothetical protein
MISKAPAFEFCIQEKSFPRTDLLSDFTDALQQAKSLREQDHTYLIHYHLSQADDRLYVLFGNVRSQQLETGELRTAEDHVARSTDIIQFLTEFHEYFAKFTNSDLKHDKDLLRLVVKGLQLFYVPFFDDLSRKTHVIFHVTSDAVLTCRTDLSQIYNLHYLLIAQPPTRDNFTISQASTEKLSVYVNALATLPKPVPTSMGILFGAFTPQNDGTTISEIAFQKTLECALHAGVKIEEFHSLKQLLALFEKPRIESLVQIIGHFHYGFLILNGEGVLLDSVAEGISDLRESDNLHPQLVIDGVNCTNYAEFNSLYAAGVKLIYSNFNDLNITLMAYILAELYSAKNAKGLGVTNYYLDGEMYLHEAYDLITRIFVHITCVQEKQITL